MEKRKIIFSPPDITEEEIEEVVEAREHVGQVVQAVEVAILHQARKVHQATLAKLQEDVEDDK